MKLFFFFIVFVLFQYSEEELNPVDLFTIRESKSEMSLEQQRVRVKYAEMLQPKLENDSLVVPINIGDCPLIYKKYVNEFVGMMNYHLKKMPVRLRYMTMGLIQVNSVKKRIVESNIKFQDSNFVMTLSENEAKELGLDKEYHEIMKFLAGNTLPMPLGFLNNDESDTSIFCDFRLLNEELSPVFVELKQAFHNLNKSYLNH